MSRVHAILIDAVLVVLFAGWGRASHGGSLDPVGVLSTGAPFLIALAVGWVALLATRRPGTTVVDGLLLWLITVVVGVVLRLVVFGDTAAPAFIVVTTLVVGLFLLGWRAVRSALTRRRPHA